MRAVGIRVADGLSDYQLAVVEQLLEGPQGGMERRFVVDFQQLIPCQPQLASVLRIRFVAEGHDGVDAVVPAFQVDHDQDAGPLSSGLAARSERARKPGTIGANAMSEDCWRNERRLIIDSSFRSA